MKLLKHAPAALKALSHFVRTCGENPPGAATLVALFAIVAMTLTALSHQLMLMQLH